MSDKILKDEDYGTRDKRGNWKPFGKVPINPPYIVPFQPIKFIKHFFAFPGLIFPWQAIFALITIFTWFFLTPSMETMKNFESGWIAFIFFRYAAIIFWNTL